MKLNCNFVVFASTRLPSYDAKASMPSAISFSADPCACANLCWTLERMYPAMFGAYSLAWKSKKNCAENRISMSIFLLGGDCGLKLLPQLGLNKTLFYSLL